MKNRSSKVVKLVLITSLLASCNKTKEDLNETKQRVFMRADSTAQYTEVTNQYKNNHSSSGMGNTLLWYMAFRHLGGGMGYANNNLHPNSVSGTNTAKANAYSKTQRGGFGKTATTNSGYKSSAT